MTVMVYQCDAEGQAWRLTRRQPDLVAADERPDDFDCISWMAALVDMYGVWSTPYLESNCTERDFHKFSTETSYVVRNYVVHFYSHIQSHLDNTPHEQSSIAISTRPLLSLPEI